MNTFIRAGENGSSATAKNTKTVVLRAVEDERSTYDPPQSGADVKANESVVARVIPTGRRAGRVPGAHPLADHRMRCSAIVTAVLVRISRLESRLARPCRKVEGLLEHALPRALVAHKSAVGHRTQVHEEFRSDMPRRSWMARLFTLVLLAACGLTDVYVMQAALHILPGLPTPARWTLAAVMGGMLVVAAWLAARVLKRIDLAKRGLIDWSARSSRMTVIATGIVCILAVAVVAAATVIRASWIAARESSSTAISQATSTSVNITSPPVPVHVPFWALFVIALAAPVLAFAIEYWSYEPAHDLHRQAARGERRASRRLLRVMKKTRRVAARVDRLLTRVDHHTDHAKQRMAASESLAFATLSVTHPVHASQLAEVARYTPDLPKALAERRTLVRARELSSDATTIFDMKPAAV